MSSFLRAIPESLTAAAGDLTGIGSSITTASAAAAASTTQLLPAAQDEISAAVSAIAARMGDPTSHGGVIVLGAPTVMIS